MPEQRLEETIGTLLAIARDKYDLEGEEERGYQLGASDGIAWQKEQGIPWVSCEELPDDQLPPVGEYVLIILEGDTFLKAKRMYVKENSSEKIWVALFLDGSHPIGNRIVTHFAYVNVL